MSCRLARVASSREKAWACAESELCVTDEHRVVTRAQARLNNDEKAALAPSSSYRGTQVTDAERSQPSLDSEMLPLGCVRREKIVVYRRA